IIAISILKIIENVNSIHLLIAGFFCALIKSGVILSSFFLIGAAFIYLGLEKLLNFCYIFKD
ncbi:MAG: hypothetical protein ACK559_04900, partial [bacterium]